MDIRSGAKCCTALPCRRLEGAHHHCSHDRNSVCVAGLMCLLVAQATQLHINCRASIVVSVLDTRAKLGFFSSSACQTPATISSSLREYENENGSMTNEIINSSSSGAGKLIALMGHPIDATLGSCQLVTNYFEVLIAEEEAQRAAEEASEVYRRRYKRLLYLRWRAWGLAVRHRTSYCRTAYQRIFSRYSRPRWVLAREKWWRRRRHSNF